MWHGRPARVSYNGHPARFFMDIGDRIL
jgi:hypothetical protein